jgi:transcriptional regulator with XRE-family HTH domain
MELPEIPDGRAVDDGTAVDYERAGPMAARMLLGSRLRKLRDLAGVSREAAGHAIRGSESKITRLELGQTGFKPRDVSDLLGLYGVRAEERVTLFTMITHANRPGWWQGYGDVVPTWFAPFLGLEQAANIIRCYEVQFIPGLLQTQDYARAVLAIGTDDAPEQEISQRASLRLRRQQILHRPHPPRLWAVIDEAALRRPIGGRSVARAQLRHLTEMARLSHISIQIAPLALGSQAVADGPITMFRFPEAELPDVVYLEQHMNAAYLSKTPERMYHSNVLNRLAIEAPPPADTADIIQKILDET